MNLSPSAGALRLRASLALCVAVLAGCAEPVAKRNETTIASSPAPLPAPPPASAPVPVQERVVQPIATPAAATQAKGYIAGNALAYSALSRQDTRAYSSNQMPAPLYMPPSIPVQQGMDKFPDKDSNGVTLVAEQPVSTFSVDVDTASYAVVRRMLSSGSMPPSAAVRVEEMVNYFPYKYATPSSRSQPFGVTTEVMPSPWNADNQLIHIAVRGYDIARDARPPANVVLLIDVSGSMGPADRLPLLKKGFRLFAAQLRDNDSVSIVTYANGTNVALEPTSGKDKDKIVAAIDALGAGGGTAGADGLQRAYAMAERNFDPKAVNRVILATDGDFNIGISDPRQLEKFIADKRKTGIYLSIFGVGTGNLNDALIQRLTQSGNGNAAYIDSLLEARKAMSEEMGSTMFPIANDVKVQVEFNPEQVAAYRLVGYETRMLKRQDFKDDKIDAGDMGAGHSVTAIYEITPASAAGKVVDPLRYKEARPTAKGGDELCFVKLRYKLPGESSSLLTEQVVHAGSARKSMQSVPEEQRFAVAVAAFGQRLRGESQVSNFGYEEIASLAESARGSDSEGYRAEFVRLVRLTDSMSKGVSKSGSVGQH